MSTNLVISFVKQTIASRLTMETNIVAQRGRFIQMSNSIHSRAWQKGQPQEPLCYYFQ